MPDTKGLDSLDLKSVFTFKVNSKTLTWHLVTAKGSAILNDMATANIPLSQLNVFIPHQIGFLTKLKSLGTRYLYYTGFLKPNLEVIVLMPHWFLNQSSAFRSDRFWMLHNTVFDRLINVDRCILR